MKITVCTCTYNRPRMLAHMLWCFTQQTHEDRYLIVLDDAGQLAPTEGDRCRIVTADRRFPSLGAKRNALAQLADETDAIAIWDDDDLYMPWALEATAAALEAAPWSRPSLVLTRQRRKTYLAKTVLRPTRTYTRPDRADRAYQSAWGYRSEVFWQVGGYDPRLSVGEDLDLAQRFMAAGVADADPIELGFPPFCVWGPWHNQHLGAGRYSEWACPPMGEAIRVEPARPVVRLEEAAISGTEMPRPWRGDWLTNYRKE